MFSSGFLEDISYFSKISSSCYKVAESFSSSAFLNLHVSWSTAGSGPMEQKMGQGNQVRKQILPDILILPEADSLRN